jgi:hypothetical protein
VILQAVQSSNEKELLGKLHDHFENRKSPPLIFEGAGLQNIGGSYSSDETLLGILCVAIAYYARGRQRMDKP